MGEKTGISWTNSTWSPVQAIRKDNGKRGCMCVKVSPGCKNCYSETIQLRNLPQHGTGMEFTVLNMAKVDIVLNEEMILQPLKWKKPRMIFVCSQTDLFGEFAPDEMIDRVFAVMALCPQHTFQVLTKRAERMLAYLTGDLPLSDRCEYVLSQAAHTGKIVWDQRGSDRVRYYGCGLIGDISNRRVPPGWPLPNVWLGISAENQEWADKRMEPLRCTPAAIRFVSFEPLLGPITADLTGISWSIIGGESGHGARPMNIQWAEDLIDQCRATATACFMKQLGANPRWAGARCLPIEPARGKNDNPLQWPESLRVQQFPEPHVPQ